MKNKILLVVAIATISSLILTSCGLATGKTAPPNDEPQFSFIANDDLYLFDSASGKIIPLTQSREHITEAVWSPDGRYLAFIETDYKTDSRIIYRLDVTNADLLRLTPVGGPDDCRGLSWSPDGIGIACHTGDAAIPPNDIYILRPDGSGMDFVTHGAYPSWSVDGGSLIYAIDKRIETIDLRSRESSTLFSLDEFAWFPKWSPDGQMVAFAAMKSTNGDVFSIKIWDGETVTKVTEDGVLPDFSWIPGRTELHIADFFYDPLSGYERVAPFIAGTTYSPDGTQWFSIEPDIGICLYPALIGEDNCTRLPQKFGSMLALAWRP